MINFFKIRFIYRLNAWKQSNINRLINKKKHITHNKTDMTFFTPNPLSNYRIKSFSTKEPETLDWIDSFNSDTIMWDIGANIGLYSIYAAKAKNLKVYAFEPSVFNLEFLAKNIYVNKLQDNITIFPIALSDAMGDNLFKMNNPVWGGALSVFGADFDQHGEAFESSFEYSTIGLSPDKAAEIFHIPKPNYLKIDVDGIEHLILHGSEYILQTVDSVLIEIDENFLEQSVKSERYLSNAGLVLKDKYSLRVDKLQFNQLWIRE